MLGLFKKWGKETPVIAVDHANDITLAVRKPKTFPAGTF